MNAKFLSGSIQLETGEIVTIGPTSDGSVVNDADYADDGFSNEALHGICYRSKAVDIYLAGLANGDEFQQAAATNAPAWFALFLPNRSWTEEDKRFLNSIRDENLEYVTSIQHSFRFMPFTPKGVDVPDEGCVLPISGVNPYDDFEGCAEAFISRMEESIGAARRASNAADAGRILPSAGPAYVDPGFTPSDYALEVLADLATASIDLSKLPNQGAMRIETGNAGDYISGTRHTGVYSVVNTDPGRRVSAVGHTSWRGRGGVFLTDLEGNVLQRSLWYGVPTSMPINLPADGKEYRLVIVSNGPKGHVNQWDADQDNE